MPLFLILGVPLALLYGLWRAAHRWGFWTVSLVVACVALFDALSIFTEPYMGWWSLNFAHHDRAHAWSALATAVCYAAYAMNQRGRGIQTR